MNAETALFATYPPNHYLAAKVRVFVDFLVARFGPVPQWDAPQPMATRVNGDALAAPRPLPAPRAEALIPIASRDGEPSHG